MMHENWMKWLKEGIDANVCVYDSTRQGKFSLRLVSLLQWHAINVLNETLILICVPQDDDYLISTFGGKFKCGITSYPGHLIPEYEKLGANFPSGTSSFVLGLTEGLHIVLGAY